MPVHIGSVVKITGTIDNFAVATGMTGVVVERHIDTDDSKFDSYIIRLSEVVTTNRQGRHDWLIAGADQFEVVTEGDGTVPDIDNAFKHKDWVEVNSKALQEQGVKGMVQSLDPYGRRFTVIFDRTVHFSNDETVEESARGETTYGMTVEPSEVTLLNRLPFGPDFRPSKLTDEELHVAAEMFRIDALFNGYPEDLLPDTDNLIEKFKEAEAEGMYDN